MKLPQRAPLYRRSDSGISLLDGHASTDLKSRLFGSLAATVVSSRACEEVRRPWPTISQREGGAPAFGSIPS
jgi:hypothetical protein